MEEKEVSRIAELVIKEMNRQKGSVEYPHDALTLQNAKQLAEKIEEKAAQIGVKPVIVICDSGGNLKYSERTDGAFLGSLKIAEEKAYTAAALKMSTQTVGKEAKVGGALEGLTVTSFNRISTLGGGEPLAVNGILHGGLGVSGGTAEEDTFLAAYGKEYYETIGGR